MKGSETPEQVHGIALIQLRPDVLAAGLADAIRRAGDILMVEPAPLGSEMLDTLAVDREIAPVVVIVGQSSSLDAQTDAFVALRPDLVLVSVPIDETRIRLEFPALALGDLIELLRWLSSGDRNARIGIERCRPPVLSSGAVGAASSASIGGGPGRLSQAWLDAALRLAMARTGTSDEGSLPGLTVSASVAQRLLSYDSQAASGALAALTVAREAAAGHLANALREGSAGEERLGLLVRRLGLQPVEWQALLLLLAPELDPLYQRVYGILHDDLSRRFASPGLIGATLGMPGELGSQIRCALIGVGGLARWWLTEPRLGPAVAAPDLLQVDPAIRAWLIEGTTADDPRLSGWWHDTPWSGAEATRDLPATAQLAEVLRGDVGWVVLTGGCGEDWRAATESAAALASRRLMRIVPPRGITLDAQQAVEIAARIGRAARLFDLVPALAADGDSDQASLAALLGHLVTTDLPGPAVLISPDGGGASLLADVASVVLPFEPIPAARRAALFHSEAERAGIVLHESSGARLAVSSRLPASMIAKAMSLARARAAGASDNTPEREVAAASRQISMPQLPRHARLVRPAFELAHVVLPPDRHAELQEIVAQCRHAGEVLDQWGFGAQLPYGRGVTALFWGPSGTGKTMAAQAIAGALDTDLYVVDLARVISKYIGETEKNLDAVFDEADRAGVALLFDEADALFAKRGEVRDAHDRYANIECAYLLQRLDDFGGLAVLTTNLRQNIDNAFLRRLRFAVEFPRPDARAREAIWRQCLPASAPLAPDVDLAALARRIELTGGHIRQVTLRAAYLAAGVGSPITMQHLIAAARAELMKIGMPAAAGALPMQPVNANAA
jgi:hypothetical protein